MIRIRFNLQVLAGPLARPKCRPLPTLRSAMVSSRRAEAHVALLIGI